MGKGHGADYVGVLERVQTFACLSVPDFAVGKQMISSMLYSNYRSILSIRSEISGCCSCKIAIRREAGLPAGTFVAEKCTNPGKVS